MEGDVEDEVEGDVEDEVEGDVEDEVEGDVEVEVEGEVAEEVVPDEAERAEADGGALEATRSNQAAPALLHVEVESIEEIGGQAENEDIGKYTYIFPL